MIRSMYSGISGMKNFQTKLDVIGNNIANVNTYGFKKGRVAFKDMVNQTISGASGPAQGKGGINPQQVGLGAQIAAIDTIDTQGSLQPTGRVLDLAIQGDGYFMVQEGTDTFYTRAGNLYLNNNGNLVTASGHFVLDNQSQRIQIPDIKNIKSLGISEDGKISFIKSDTPSVPGFTKDGDLFTSVSSIGIARFNNPGGLEKVGENLYVGSANSGLATPMIPNNGGAGTIVSGALEMSNVDLSEEFTEMIVAQRGFQANTRIITTSDEILQELINLKR
ncbi:flagellar basal body rod protein FlgG [Bacillus sp. FSL K6-3431]|uniref:flagellar basal body rod protein FlgG n=1 Tax=Bacillus sp. FSL K6-3431 TaxID=2921500 RepID=UPI0030F617EB